MFPIHFAPLQGYTDAVYRRLHHQLAGGIAAYYTPFVRLEKGQPRSKDLREITPDASILMPVVPQIIVSDRDEFCRLTDLVCDKGHHRIDLNMGCAFPLQTRLGRGSALLTHPTELEAIARELAARPEVTYSVKMRLGMDNVEEGLAALRILADVPLAQVCVHARTANMQFRGEPDHEAFGRFVESCPHPLLYNGDIRTLDDLHHLEQRWPTLAGVMIGRGLLARPTLAREYAEGHELPLDQRLATVCQLHDALWQHATTHLQGTSQILARMQAFWQYQTDDIPRRTYKRLMKSTTLHTYEVAYSQLAENQRER